jgi:hypothetical protein
MEESQGVITARKDSDSVSLRDHERFCVRVVYVLAWLGAPDHVSWCELHLVSYLIASVTCS